MLLHASCFLEITTETPVPTVFMLHTQSVDGQSVYRDELVTVPYIPGSGYLDIFGNLCRRIVIPEGLFQLESHVVADCEDHIAVNMDAAWMTVPELPDSVLQFLLPSRYCESDKLGEEAARITQGAAPGYAQVEAIRQWINTHIRYEYGTSNSSTSAVDALAAGVGVCRDFTHMGIALCRSLDIPARMVVGYLYDLKPMDLHAWFEAYVGGKWYCFDATQSRPRGNRIVIAYGRDAADVAFATHFGYATLQKMIVNVVAG